jgi:uncharacterized membrane protein YeaQ/YmgE (transglycosylase-associated protein family)
MIYKVGWTPSPHSCKGGQGDPLVFDIVALVIWAIAGVIGGMAAGELLKGNYDLGPGNAVAGAIGGVVGAQFLGVLIPALRDFDFGPVVSQLIVAAVSGAALTIIAGTVKIWRGRKR